MSKSLFVREEHIMNIVLIAVGTPQCEAYELLWL